MKPLVIFKQQLYETVWNGFFSYVNQTNDFTMFIENRVNFFQRPGFFGYKSHFSQYLVQLEEAITQIDQGSDE